MNNVLAALIIVAFTGCPSHQGAAAGAQAGADMGAAAAANVRTTITQTKFEPSDTPNFAAPILPTDYAQEKKH